MGKSAFKTSIHTKTETEQFSLSSLDKSWETLNFSQLTSRLFKPNSSVSVFVCIGVLKADFPTLSDISVCRLGWHWMFIALKKVMMILKPLQLQTVSKAMNHQQPDCFDTASLPNCFTILVIFFVKMTLTTLPVYQINVDFKINMRNDQCKGFFPLIFGILYSCL